MGAKKKKINNRVEDWASYTKSTRTWLGLSQAKLARVLCVTEFALQRWESGISEPHSIQQDILLNMNAYRIYIERKVSAKSVADCVDKAEAFMRFCTAEKPSIRLYQLFKLMFENNSLI